MISRAAGFALVFAPLGLCTFFITLAVMGQGA
jgi:hypothetical protein